MARSTWHGKHEVGHMNFGGRGSPGGSPAIPGKQASGWVLTTWGGDVIGPLSLVRTWKQYGPRGGYPTTMHAWSMRYQGRTFTGRNAGAGMFLRLKHASARDAHGRDPSSKGRRSRTRRARRGRRY